MVSSMQGKGDKADTADQRASERAEFFTAITQSFNGFTYGGLSGDDMFHAFYSDGYLYFIADGLDRFIGDAGNFKPNS